ncbi:MAG: hypothetical protein Q7T55_25390 [Solirubrobacteraceae bacterium]|nr:hypothetical protein [Solirubrobacteraceae bacterium]
MKLPALRRVQRAGTLVALAAAALVAPSGASADIPITSFSAGPVTTYNNPAGLPFIPGATAADAPVTYDASCAYGTPVLGSTGYTYTGPEPALGLKTQAGANSDYCVKFKLDSGDASTGEDLENTLVQLPVGSLGEIDNAAKCTVEEFARESSALSNCATNTQIGTAMAQLQVNPKVGPFGPGGTLAPNPSPQTIRVLQDTPGRIFALTTPSDKAALLGVALVGSQPAGTAETKFLITVSQKGEATVGLLNQTDKLAKTLASVLDSDIAIRANALRFWGKAAEHPHIGNKGGAPATPAANFFRVGTTCSTPQVTTLTVNPYTDVNTASKPTVATSAPYTLTGCEALPFNPTFTAGISGETTAGGHPALNVKITSPEGDEDLGATQITLPAGIATDLTRIQDSCPQATFKADACTDATVIGSVKATLSGINADVVTGVIHKVRVEGESLPALGFDFNGRLPLQVSGVTKIDAQGRIVNTFSSLPSIPQRSLEINLAGGAKGILQVNSAKCQQSGYDAILTGQNGKAKSFSIRTTCPEQITARLENADTTRPSLFIGGAGATGKKIETMRVTLPSGLTMQKNRSKSGIKFDKFEAAVKGEGKALRLNSKTLKLRIPKPGSSGLRVITRTGTLGASKKFADRTNAITLDVRMVYTDGTKANIKVPMTRKNK